MINHNRRFFLHFASGVNIEKEVAKKINSVKVTYEKPKTNKQKKPQRHSSHLISLHAWL